MTESFVLEPDKHYIPIRQRSHLQGIVTVTHVKLSQIRSPHTTSHCTTSSHMKQDHTTTHCVTPPHVTAHPTPPHHSRSHPCIPHLTTPQLIAVHHHDHRQTALHHTKPNHTMHCVDAAGHDCKKRKLARTCWMASRFMWLVTFSSEMSGSLRWSLSMTCM